METNNASPQHPAPRHAQPGMMSRPAAPVGRRPIVDGFAPRRPAMPAHNTGAPAHPHRAAAPHHIPVGGSPAAVHAPAPQPPRPTQPVAARPVNADFAPRPQAAAVPRAQTPVPETREFTPPAADDLPPEATSKPPKERSQTGHSGLIGLAVFIVLGALLASPFVPGKVMQSFPLTSESFSTGDQSLDCLGTQGQIKSTTTYNSKAGSPITYTYSTTTKQSATCNGNDQTAVAGHNSQFNPLGLLADLAVALVVAIAVAKVWRLVYTKRQKH